MSTSLEQYDSCVELYRSGKVEDAVAGLRKLRETAPDFALTYNALAAYAKKNGDLIDAINNAEEYCRCAPDDPFGFTILSSYCIEAGQREKAEEALAKGFDLRFKNHGGPDDI